MNPNLPQSPGHGSWLGPAPRLQLHGLYTSIQTIRPQGPAEPPTRSRWTARKPAGGWRGGRGGVPCSRIKKKNEKKVPLRGHTCSKSRSGWKVLENPRENSGKQGSIIRGLFKACFEDGILQRWILFCNVLWILCKHHADSSQFQGIC